MVLFDGKDAFTCTRQPVFRIPVETNLFFQNLLEKLTTS